MTESVILHSQFNPNQLKFSSLSKTNKGGKICYYNLPNHSRIKLQLPVMTAVFGVSCFDDQASGNISFSIDASFKGFETNPKLAKFLETCRTLDDVILKHAVHQSRAFWGKELGTELVAELFRKSIRDSADPKYAPTLRLKITPNSEFFDAERNVVDKEYITKGSTFRAIVELGSLFFVGKTFGTSWRLCQVCVVSRPDRLAGFAFQADEEEMIECDDNEEDGQV
jgi:Family of unknown function (DUF5871)